MPYGAQLAAGDIDVMRVILDWASALLPLARARTNLLLPSESGVFFTETVNVFGLFQDGEYSCSARPEGYPIWLEGPGSTGGWVRYDFGGNALGPEAGLMALDYYLHTGDAAAAARYIPIATETLDFFASHYPNRTADGKLLLWPTQVLETYWCEWPGWVNCCQNDMPQVAAVTSLATRLLSLPESSGLLTPEQRAAYSSFVKILPPLPLTSDGAQYAPATVVSNGVHNAEVPELFAVHPFRLVTAGRAAVDASVNLSIGIATWRALPLAKENTGWCVDTRHPLHLAPRRSNPPLLLSYSQVLRHHGRSAAGHGQRKLCNGSGPRSTTTSEWVPLPCVCAALPRVRRCACLLWGTAAMVGCGDTGFTPFPSSLPPQLRAFRGPLR